MAINRINFTGEIFMPKQTDKFGFIIKGKSANKKEYLRMNLGVKENEHNMAFTEMFGSEQDVIKVKDTDGNNLDIDWKNRFDPDLVAVVAFSRKTIVDFTGLVVPSSLCEKLDELHVEYEEADLGVELKRAEFLSQYDAIKYVGLVSEQLKGKRILVTGQHKINAFKGKFSDRYQATNIYLAREDAKNGLFVYVEVFFNKDSYDGADEKTEKVTRLNGYVPMYINKDEGTKYMPKTFVFNYAKADTEATMKRADYIKDQMKAPKNRYFHLPFKCKILNGSEQVEVTYDMLTKKQKESIDLGFNTLQDYQKRTFGDRIQETRIVAPCFNETGFDDGMVECEETNNEFEEMIYRFVEVKEEKLEDIVEKEEVPFEENKEELDDEDIFG